MDSLDLQAQFSAATTLTSTGFLTNCIDQLIATAHMENELDSVGLLVVLNGAPAVNGTQTYQFQVISDSAANGTTTPLVVADTGTMGPTDIRLTQDKIFLEIGQKLLTQEFICVKFTGANTPSMPISGAWLTRKSAVQNFQPYPLNYVP